jgi:cyclase
MHWIRCLTASLLAWSAFSGAAFAITGNQSEFTKIADDVYAYIGKRNDANALVIVTKQGVVLVDTGNDQEESRAIKKRIAEVTDQPIRYVVISQNHGDHIGGVPYFAPPATVIVHDRVAQDLAKMKPYEIRSWRKRFPERTEALKDVAPIDVVMSFKDRMTLHLGGREIQLLNVDDTYNMGDVAVWMPKEGVMHASFAGYKDRHPDIRPDYSHGTTWGMLKQLEALIALKPRVVVPAHGPLSNTGDLQRMVDYLIIARERVRGMMEQGLPVVTIEKQFKMDEFKGWDRTAHLPWLAATLYRELQGEGPEVHTLVEKRVSGTISALKEEGRYLAIAMQGGEAVNLRVTSATDIEGVADRTRLATGMTVDALYQIPEGGKAVLGFDVLELNVNK